MRLGTASDWRVWEGENRAVSPVIATILIVAIVVIIAASVGSVVFGFTDNLGNPAPSAVFDYKNQGDRILITHSQGEQISADNLEINVFGSLEEGNITVPDTLRAGSAIIIENATGVNGVSIDYVSGSQSAKLSSDGDTSGEATVIAGSDSSASASPVVTAEFIGNIDGNDPETQPVRNEISIKVIDENGDPAENTDVEVAIVGDSDVLAGSSQLFVDDSRDSNALVEPVSTDGSGNLPGPIEFSPEASLVDGTVVELKVTALGETTTDEYEVNFS